MGDTLVMEADADAVASTRTATRSELNAGRRRFTVAALIGTACTAVPFLWILWSSWGPVNLLRPSVYQDNFYDLQARAMFHGHLSLANGALGIEGFVHGGRTYTYFGLFPSLIRMPVLLVTSSLDGRLTAPSILLAWLLSGLFAGLLLWRVRFLVRGDAVMGVAEATAFGALMAGVMGGTVWMLLGATPFVFNEDIAWSICLTIGSIFALLGVLERPTWGRVLFSGVLILCANLDRATTGWACVVGAGLIAVWFAFGFGGRENRRWSVPVLAAGVIPLIVGCVVNYSKFGVLFGVSNQEQVWTHLNAYRRKFLAANHDAEEGLIFVPTNALAYLRLDGLRFTSVFPFVTLPAAPPPTVGGVLFDRLYRTASLPSSAPLLVLLSIWGMITAFRPRSIGKVARTRILLLASGSAGAALLLWGYIAPRYLGDFVPFLALASAVAMADIWRRLEGRSRGVRGGVLGLVGLVALFGIVANVGMAVVPNSDEWGSTQTLNFVRFQNSISNLTGHTLSANVVRGNVLPPWGPAGELYVIGDCDGLYISSGEDYATVPSQQFVRQTWMTVERGHGFVHTFRLTVDNPGTGRAETIPLVTAGESTITLDATPVPGSSSVRIAIRLTGQGPALQGRSFTFRSGSTRTVAVTTDPVKHQLGVSIGYANALSGKLLGGEPIASHVTPVPDPGGPPSVTAVDTTASSPQPTLCQSLIR